MEKNRQRFFLSVFFFLSGICFSTWASRIPTIKATFGFNEAELGTLLLCMPISSLVGLPISGWLVSKFDSRMPMTFGFVSLALSLIFIGFAPTTFTLIVAICCFSFSMRIMNISINTQALTLQKLFEKKINGSFHGLWSTGGIAGVGISTFFVARDIPIHWHFMIVAVVAILVALYSYRFLIRNDRTSTGNKLSLARPDPYIVYLGLMLFLTAICEGGMFDWSGVYFREVMNEELFTLGYLSFMISMALSRFASDSMVERIGMPKTYLVSGAFIFLGIMLAILWPSFWPAMVGFCLVGFGAASVIPVTFLLAGQSKKYSPGMAISIITTYSISGMLLGPALIGYIAHAFNLRAAFVTFAIAGLLLIPVSRLFFRKERPGGKKFE
jgi:MFS family permease